MTTPECPPSAPLVEPRRQISSLQVLRGFAAIAVAFYHAQIIMAQPEYGGITLLQGIATKGWLGVNFFFVLSGFIISYAHHNDIGKPDRVGKYAWRRFARVYPVYWIYLTGYICAAALGIGNPDFSWDLEHLLSAYSLIPMTWAPSIPLQPAWTLFFEIGFYLVFACIILNRIFGLTVITIWVLAIGYTSFILGQNDFWPLHVWNIYFLVGIGTHLAYRKTPTHWWPMILAAGVITLIAMLGLGLIDDHLGKAIKKPLAILALAIPFAMILLGVILLEGATGWQAPKSLMFLGNASYSIYLIHSPVLSVLAALSHNFISINVHPLLLYSAFVTLSVAAGAIAHLVIEQPIINALNKAKARRSMAKSDLSPAIVRT